MDADSFSSLARQVQQEEERLRDVRGRDLLHSDLQRVVPADDVRERQRFDRRPAVPRGGGPRVFEQARAQCRLGGAVMAVCQRHDAAPERARHGQVQEQKHIVEVELDERDRIARIGVLAFVHNRHLEREELLVVITVERGDASRHSRGPHQWW